MTDLILQNKKFWTNSFIQYKNNIIQLKDYKVCCY